MSVDSSLVDAPPYSDWQTQIREAIRDPLELCDRLGLPDSFREPALLAARDFPVFAPQSYVRRMRVGDADDPLLRQVLPLAAETEDVQGFVTDPVADEESKQRPGLIQKYRGRVLLITTGMCAVHCRYCFRRHYPYESEPRSHTQWDPAIQYIASDDTIHEVILSGGDPLTLSDARLGHLVERLESIPHLRRLRIHTRLPIVIPARITGALTRTLEETRMQAYVVIHANHANELNDEVLSSITHLRESGATLLNQAVLLRGVNDDVVALTKLCEQLSDHGVLPYYLHQLDRVQGAAHFEVPMEKGEQLIEALREQLPGYAVPRYVQEIAGEPGKSVLL